LRGGFRWIDPLAAHGGTPLPGGEIGGPSRPLQNAGGGVQKRSGRTTMSKSIRVLIVEDSEEDAGLLVHELRRGGYEPVYRRVDTEQTMGGALAEQAWNIVISDYNLPQFSAPAALKLLQESGLDLPFIIVSGVIGEDVAVEAMKAGAHDCVMKYNLQRLLPAVERELREAEIRRTRRQAEEELKFRNAILSTQQETSPDAILVVDEEARIISYNKQFVDLWGIPEEMVRAAVDEPVLQSVVRQMKDPEAFLARVRYLYEHKQERSHEELSLADGRVVDRHSAPMFGADDRYYGRVWYFRDITERRAAEEMAQRVAYYDTLTGLPNRSLLYNRLVSRIRTGAEGNKRTALLVMNLNRFREINDTLGHGRGDEIIKRVGERLRTAMYDRDIVARPGGDEFTVLMIDLADSGDIALAVQKILNVLDHPFLIDNIPVRIEASIGVALYPDHGESAEVLFRRADVAMHVSKKTGASYIVYDPARDKHSPQRLGLMGELHFAIEHNELTLFYQPKIDMKTRHIMGVEGLVRWNHPHRGMIPPDQFILPAEQTGLIHPLTRWVVAAGMRQCKAWREAGMELTVSVNLSARNLLDPKLPTQVGEQLRSTGVNPDWMQFEITESAIMSDPVHALDVLMKLHGMGIHFSIDDFGIGYSSLDYLQKLPVDTIKIDKSFIVNMIRNPNNTVIVRSTIDLAHNLGLRAVAEGLENKDLWDRLETLGCDIAQGYYMCKPMPADDLMRWLHESPWGLSSTSVSNPS
jgi:diguanylate cyclase (GGDEF)-like protein/PAS domain S-box-containing protein